MIAELKPCKCGKEISNKHFSLCKFCNKKRLDERRPKKKAYRYIRKKTGEGELFRQIWNERKHYCHNCGKYLGNEMKAIFFSHIKPKSVYRELRLNKENITLLCDLCHDAYGNRGKEVYEKRTLHN